MGKQEGYKIRMTKFLGSDEYGYTYEIKFNKSLEHTGRYEGIEQGLDAYVKREAKEEVANSFKRLMASIIYFFKTRFTR